MSKDKIQYTGESIKAALESGDGAKLSEVLAAGYNAPYTSKDDDRRSISINPQIQKLLAEVILDTAGAELPEVVRKSTNPAVAALETLRGQLKAAGQLNKTVEAALDEQIEAASKTFVASDGVQKGWQAFVTEAVAYFFETKLKQKSPAAALRGAVAAIVDYGAKRPFNSEEKAVFKAEKTGKKAKKAATETEDEEEEVEE